MTYSKKEKRRRLQHRCKENLSVKTLDVGYNGFPGGDVVHIAKGLAGNTTLTSPELFLFKQGRVGGRRR